MFDTMFTRLVAKLEETQPSEVDTFKSNMSKVMKDLLGRFKDLQFFTGITVLLSINKMSGVKEMILIQELKWMLMEWLH